MKKILLLSGGMDSLLIYQQKKDIINNYVYFDYGHRFAKKEFEKIKKLKINIERIKLKNMIDKNGFFFGRNLRFMIAIRERYKNDNILVFFGNNADDTYNDNTREYLYRVEKIINDSYPEKTLRIICPLENMTKEDIYKQIKKYNNVDYYYCDSGKDSPCKKCHSCLAMIEAGLL